MQANSRRYFTRDHRVSFRANSRRERNASLRAIRLSRKFVASIGVHVEWLETKRTDATTEAEAKRLHKSLKTENGELRYEIVKPIAGLRYQFYIRAVRTNAPLPVSIRQLAADTFFEELPELLERQRNDRNNKWVAYHGAKRLGMAASKIELLKTAREAGLTLDDFLIFRIDPQVI